MRQSDPIQLYTSNQLQASAPVLRLIKLYQIGVLACKNQDQIRVIKVLWLLNKSLNQDKWPELAANLSRIYSHLHACVNEGKYDYVEKTLTKLLDQWQNLNKV